MNDTPDFIRQFLQTIRRWIIRFKLPVYSRPLPSEKIGEDVSVGGGGDCTQASLRRIIHF